MRLKMLLDTAKKWWKPKDGTVTMLDLIWAKAQVKLCLGLTFILSPVEKAMSKIQRAVSEIRYQAKETILRRHIEATTIEFILPESSGPYQVHAGAGVGNVGFGYPNTGQYNTAIGYQAGYVKAGAGLSIANIIPNNSIAFNQNGKQVLVITNDGDVEWHGKPSEAADALVRTFQFKVEDMKGVTKAARRRYYLRACQNILNKAENMEHDDFIAFLQKRVYNKERRVIVDHLQGVE